MLPPNQSEHCGTLGRRQPKPQTVFVFNDGMSQCSLAIFYAFARSGGTLVNRCLSSIDSNLVLSEVNPLASPISIEYQATHWLRLLEASEIEEFNNLSYTEKILLLKTRSLAKDFNLIIRDWSTVNFLDLGSILTDKVVIPSFVLEQEMYLNYANIDCQAVVISRKAADIYASLKCFSYLNHLAVEKFSKAYLKYALSVADHKVFHYEAFCSDPETILNAMCQSLNVNYDQQFVNLFYSFNKCTGDNMQEMASRGTRKRQIEPLASRKTSEHYIEAQGNQECQQADEILGY